MHKYTHHLLCGNIFTAYLSRKIGWICLVWLRYVYAIHVLMLHLNSFSVNCVVKSVWCNPLSEENLMHLLWIKVTGPSLEIFCNDYCNITMDKWYNDKNRRLAQNKRKKYWKRKTNKKQRSVFELLPLLETSSEESDSNI